MFFIGFANPVSAISLQEWCPVGSWDSANSKCTISSSQIADIATGEELYLEIWETIDNFGTINNQGLIAGSEGHIKNNICGTINNDGTIHGAGSGAIDNYGTFNNRGDIVQQWGHSINNVGIFNNEGTIRQMTATINNDGTFNNNGVINSDNGWFNNNICGEFCNYDTIYWAFGTITNYGTIVNHGEIWGTMGAGISNHIGGTIDNYGTIEFSDSSNIENCANINNKAGGTICIINDGVFGYIRNEVSGTINNAGTIFLAAAIQNAVTIYNYGTICNACTGIINNQGTIEGNSIIQEECTQIPEFPTTVLPIAGVIGLMFLFQRRKGK